MQNVAAVSMQKKMAYRCGKGRGSWFVKRLWEHYFHVMQDQF